MFVINLLENKNNKYSQVIISMLYYNNIIRVHVILILLNNLLMYKNNLQIYDSIAFHGIPLLENV